MVIININIIWTETLMTSHFVLFKKVAFQKFYFDFEMTQYGIHRLLIMSFTVFFYSRLLVILTTINSGC